MNHNPIYEMALNELYDTDNMNWAALKNHVWTANTKFEFQLVGLSIQHFIKEKAKASLPLKEGDSEAMKVTPDHTIPVLREGLIPFTHGDKLYVYHAISEHGNKAHAIHGAEDINPLVKLIEYCIAEKNPLRGQYLKITGTGDDFDVSPVEPLAVSEHELVLPKNLNFDLLEREILGPLMIGESCGSIFHGMPGVGKSLTCRYLAGRAKALGFTTVEITSRIDYNTLQDFSRYLGPTLLLLEDIDVNVGENRRGPYSSGNNMSDFLQSLSGISGGPNPVSVVATTNDIEALDKAVRERPGRFNRKWTFELPESEQVADLLKVYFGADTLSHDQVERLSSYNLTGDLIRELHRTARVTAKSTDRPIADCIEDAFSILQQHFDLESERIGFLA